MASTASEDLENDWTFVDSDGKIDIQARKDSVSYSKSPSTRGDVLASPSEVPPRDDSESEPEFEVLSGFQCHLPLTVDQQRCQAAEGAQDHDGNLHESSGNSNGEVEDDPGSIQENGCQCAAADGIMIISNHFCANDLVDSPGDIPCEDSPASECDQIDGPSSNITFDAADGWGELPQLSESGSLSFPSDLNSSGDDDDIEPIPEEDVSQDFVDLSRESCGKRAESRCSLFSFDSDLFNPNDLDEDINEEEDSGIAEDCRDDNKEKDLNVDETSDHLTTVDRLDGSSVFVDVPTLFVLLGVTTALGFSIGYGLSVYIGSQPLDASGNIKRPGSKTSSFPLSSDPLEPLDEVSGDFLEQLTMWKLEDRPDPRKEQEPDTELGDLFDTKALHEKLQQKHFKLMSQHEGVKQRLRMSKVMSWFWRLKYEEEKSKRGGGHEWNEALLEQLERMEQLYLHEKHVADLWRSVNENTKLHRAMASGIKFDKYWKDFLIRSRKTADRTLGVNESQKLTDSNKLDESSEMVTTTDKELEPKQINGERVRDRTRKEFINRWTKDSRSQLKGYEGESCCTNENCASGDTEKITAVSVSSEEGSLTTGFKRRDLSPLFSPVFVNGAAKGDVREQDSTSVKYSERGEESKSFLRGEDELFESKPQNVPEEFENGPLYDNVRFSQEFFAPWIRDKVPAFLKVSGREKTEVSAAVVKPALKGERDVWEETQFTPKGRKVNLDKMAVESCQDYIGKSKKDGAMERRGVLKSKKVRGKQNDGTNTSAQFEHQSLRKQKQILRNLTQYRGEEIRKHRIQRRELKKKEKEVKQRVEDANRFLLELKRERRAIKMEKKKLRRSWRELKKEKKTFSRERRIHKKDKRGLEEFTAKLKEEKLKLKKLKGKFKERMKELLAKEKKGFKLKEKLEAEKRKEVDRLRDEIVQEKERLRKQRRSLKALKKAARKELKKWLREVKKLKRREKKRRDSKLTKQQGKKKKFEKQENERRRKTEYDAVVREQARYDIEKRRKKGEYHREHENEKAANNEKRDDDPEIKTEASSREYFFRKQIENLKQWLSGVHQETVEKQRSYWGSLFDKTIFNRNGGAEDSEVEEEGYKSQSENIKRWLSSVHRKTVEMQKAYMRSLIPERILNSYGGTGNSEPNEEVRVEVKEAPKRASSSEEDKEKGKMGSREEEIVGLTKWENEKNDVIKLLSESEKHSNKQKEKKTSELMVSKAELTATQEDKALTDFVNLTFDVDLVKTLLKGLEKEKREGKSTSDEAKAADTRAFVMVSKESIEEDSSRGSDAKRKKSPKKPRKPVARSWFVQVPIDAGESRTEPRDLHQRKSPEGPIPPEGFRLSPEEWHEERSGIKSKTKKVVPQGPKVSKEGPPRRTRKQDVAQGEMCTVEDSDEREGIPPPDWIFQRAKERARGRADLRSVPWYEKRAQDRYSKRSTDEHVTQFPCGPWYHRRAQDRSAQRRRHKHAAQFPCGADWKHREDQGPSPCYSRKSQNGQWFKPWYERRAEDRNYQRRNDKHKTQFPHGQKRKRNQDWYFEGANARAYQRSSHDQWSSRRTEGPESQRREGLHPWVFGDWMPQGPHMDEHRSQ